MLDSVMPPLNLEFSPEENSKLGNNQIRKDWKSASMNLVISFNTIRQALTNMGYNNIQYQELKIDNYFSKSNSWIAMWELTNLTENQNDKSI